MPKKIKKSSKDSQREVYALIDSASALLDTLPEFTDGVLDLITKKSFAISFSPLEYLFNLLQIIGVDEETIKGWLVDIFTAALPPIEVAVKAELLKGLKGVLDCHIDPFIPEMYRKPYSDGYFTPRGIKKVFSGDLIDAKGVIVNIDAIDPDLMLTKSPLSEIGRDLYFGQYHYDSNEVVESYDEDKNSFELIPTPEKVSMSVEPVIVGQRKVNPYEFVRAADFNAFLWLCIHKSRYPAPTVLSFVDENTVVVGGCQYNVLSGSSLADYLVLTKSLPEDENSINIGATFTSEGNKTLLSVAIQVFPVVKIVPVSSDWNSSNWYVDRKRYFKENLTSTISSEREYGNELGVFNIKYMKPSDYYLKGADVDGNENLQFTVLPKPYVITPTLAANKGWNIKIKVAFAKILFDGAGKPTTKGKNTINPGFINYSGARVDNSGTLWLHLYESLNGRVNSDYYLYFKNEENYGISLLSEGSPTLAPAYIIEKYTTECYPGLTLYELNYDYVMGMRIFDPQVLTKRLIDNIFNPEYNATFSLSFGSKSNTSTRGGNAKADSASFVNAKYKILNMVKKIVEEEDELSDCFFSFTNDDYEEMLKQSAEARYHETPYRLWNKDGNSVDTTDIDRILGTYPVEGTLNEQREVISKAIEQAMITAENKSISLSSEGGGNSLQNQGRNNSSTSRVQFATDMFSQLTATLIDALITPKLLLILEVNNQMIGNTKPSLSIDALVGSVESIIKSVVRELLDLIMQKMLDYIMSYIREIISQLTIRYAEEQIKSYLAILLSLISLFKKGLKIAKECQNRISSRFGSNGDVYNQAISEYANGINNFDFDLPILNQNLNYFDVYIPEKNNEEPKISDC